MTKTELLETYEMLRRLRADMKTAKAPIAMQSRIKDALLAVSWMVDRHD